MTSRRLTRIPRTHCVRRHDLAREDGLSAGADSRRRSAVHPTERDDPGRLAWHEMPVSSVPSRFFREISCTAAVCGIPMHSSWPWAEPGTPSMSSSTRLTGRNPANQRRPIVNLPIRIDMRPVVVLGGAEELNLEIRRGARVAVTGEPSDHYTRPRPGLIELGAMALGEMNYTFILYVHQESAPSTARVRFRRHPSDTAEFFRRPGRVRALGRVETVRDSVTHTHFSESARDALLVCREVAGGRRRSRIADRAAGGQGERCDQVPWRVTAVALLGLGELVGPGRSCGMGAVPCVHVSLLDAPDHRPNLPIPRGHFDVNIANRPDLGTQVGISAVEEGDGAARRSRSDSATDCRLVGWSLSAAPSVTQQRRGPSFGRGTGSNQTLESGTPSVRGRDRHCGKASLISRVESPRRGLQCGIHSKGRHGLSSSPRNAGRLAKWSSGDPATRRLSHFDNYKLSHPPRCSMNSFRRWMSKPASDYGRSSLPPMLAYASSQRVLRIDPMDVCSPAMTARQTRPRDVSRPPIRRL